MRLPTADCTPPGALAAQIADKKAETERETRKRERLEKEVSALTSAAEYTRQMGQQLLQDRGARYGEVWRGAAPCSVPTRLCL